MKTLHYDDSKDLYEGIIVEIDDGVQSQVAHVFPDFREEYGYKFAAALDMYEALRMILPDKNDPLAQPPLHGRWDVSGDALEQCRLALAKAEKG